MGIIVNGIRALGRIWSRKWSFLGLFLLIFLLMVLLLATLDLLPEGPSAKASESNSATTTTAVAVEPAVVPEPQEPVKVEIKKIGLLVTIANPDTTDVEELDRYLLKGAIRYPTSAELNVNGNVVLFGHSSYLPIVKNLAYKSFNDIQKLKSGDIITVYSLDTAYTYTVRTVEKERAQGTEGAIPLQVAGKVLTLATCNSFATKSDRFVVTADFVESHPLGV
jgi:LPXTG-site transpeptidase (sortase) family protein